MSDNLLTAARKSLATELDDAGVRVLPTVPVTFSPPLCWIAPRTPYRQQGQSFGRKRITMAVVCIAGSGTNAEALEKLDEMVTQVADLVEASESFRLAADEIDAPGLYSSAQGQEFLGAAVNVTVELAR